MPKITFPGPLPSADDSTMTPAEPRRPRTTVMYPGGYIQVGDAHDGSRGPAVSPKLRVAAPALPVSDPLRQLRGDFGNAEAVAASVKASGGAPPTPYRIRSAAPPAPTQTKPFRVK